MSVEGRWAKPTIVGRAITLRPVSVDDADPAQEMMDDPEGTDLTATTETFTIDVLRNWYGTRGDTDERIDLAVIENETGEFAGEVVLNEYDAERNAANFRIALRGPAWFGRGLGTEATELIIEHGLRVIGLDVITLSVLQRNPRAIRAYEKAGFRRISIVHEDGENWVHMEVTGPGRGNATTVI